MCNFFALSCLCYFHFFVSRPLSQCECAVLSISNRLVLSGRAFSWKAMSRKWLFFNIYRRAIFLGVSIKMYFKMRTAVIAKPLTFVSSVAFCIITYVSSGTQNGETSFPFKSAHHQKIFNTKTLVRQSQNFTYC